LPNEVLHEDRLLRCESCHAPAGVFPGTINRATQRQPTNRGGLPRQLPLAAAVCPTTRGQGSRTPRAERRGCALGPGPSSINWSATATTRFAVAMCA
jgi:hypothetical protein